MNHEMSNNEQVIDKESIAAELEMLAEILKDVEVGGQGVDYADTADTMQALDGLLMGVEEYSNLSNLRKEASQMIINGDESSKAEGFIKLQGWIEKVRNIVE